MRRTTAKLLIVEDNPFLGPDLVRTFETPARRHRDAFAIDRFSVDLATNRADAEAWLKKAADSYRPYDVLLLDLEIPESKDRPALMDEGFKILPRVNDLSCSQVVLNSLYIDLKKLHHPVQSGIFDYIIKKKENEIDDDDRAYTFQVVANAYRRSALQVSARWGEFLRKRSEQWRLVQTCASMLDHVSRIVTDGVGQLREHGQILGELLAARYDLRPNRDADDVLCRALLDIMKDTERIAADLPDVRRFLGDASLEEAGEQHLQEKVIEDLVRASAGNCLPGLASKGLSFSYLPRGRHKARIFSHDVQMIVDELMCNAIEASDCGGEISVDVAEMNGSQGEQTIEIQVKDHAKSIEEADRAAVISGSPVGIKHGRIWGLSLAQRVAENSGGWIDIQPSSSEIGNTVTLHIPVAS
jgi:signal transduction histidine kinase